MVSNSQILFVDEDKALLGAVSALLRKSGYQVDSVDQPLMAIKTLETKHYDLLLVDCRMKEMDWALFVRHLEQHFVNLPLILFTEGARGVEQEYPDVEVATAIVEKSVIGTYDLTEVIQRVLELQNVNRQLCELNCEDSSPIDWFKSNEMVASPVS